ncbi:hypothetical protein SAMN02787142_2441 [Burkholderia sp. WP9]|nr:hypothetical protein SAMN02787142_2441 [Burkholderia sp. WP9]
MTERFRARVHHPARVFMPVQAILGYPNRYAREPAVAEHRQKFVDFSRKLRAVLASLLGECYSLREDRTVLTISGFARPMFRATVSSCPTLVCCHYTCPMVGARVAGPGC